MSDTINALRREALCNGFGREYPRGMGCQVERPCPCARQGALIDALEREMAEMLKTIEQINVVRKPHSTGDS